MSVFYQKRIFKCFLTICVSVFLTAACTAGQGGGDTQSAAVSVKEFETSYMTLFDTFTVIKGYAEDEEAFTKEAKAIYDRLYECHCLFDIYEPYEGINNLYVVNKNAGKEPVETDRLIIDLLLYCRQVYEDTGGAVDVTLGPVLAIWHNIREAAFAHPEEAVLPDTADLQEAKKLLK